MDIVVKAMKKKAWHKGFIDSLEKSFLETIGELMKKENMLRREIERLLVYT